MAQPYRTFPSFLPLPPPVSSFPSGGSNSDESPLSEVPPHLQNRAMLPTGQGYFAPPFDPPGFQPLPPGWPTERGGSGGRGAAKTSRSQFSACGACRHRRVKCDLKQKQEATKGRKAACSNCVERNVICVDEYGPMKAAKQLRKGKRINEVEQLYGKAESKSSTSSQGVPDYDEPSLPELTPEFFQSAFFKRLLIQRPIIDAVAFPKRYLSAPRPCAAAMGVEGAILCHILFSWAASYGVNERGELDVPEGGGGDELEREEHREIRRVNTQSAIRVVLKEIDDAAIMRRPTWDGVRCMLLVLPLTEGLAQPLERLAMYECAVGQVYSLCSLSAITYDGLPASSADASESEADGHLVRVRIYWYAFVHEGITTGLKGGRMILDEEDMDTMQDALQQQGALVKTSAKYKAAAKLATAPVRLAIACRLIHRALTGPRARKRETVDAGMLHEAWEALERCWEEFEAIRWSGTTSGIREEELIRFSDGWKIFLFEAQNVIRESLEHRLSHLASRPTLTDLSLSDNRYIHIQHLYEIARGKCQVKTKQIISIVREHLGSRFFEWDASLVRDGTYYCAMLLAKETGSEHEISLCLQALNELRWGFAKARERSENLRHVWATRETTSLHNPDGPWHPISFASSIDNFDLLSIPKLAEPPLPSSAVTAYGWHEPEPPLTSPTYGYFAQPPPHPQFTPPIHPQFTPPINISPNDVSYFPQVPYDQQYAEGYPYVQQTMPPNRLFQ